MSTGRTWLPGASVSGLRVIRIAVTVLGGLVAAAAAACVDAIDAPTLTKPSAVAPTRTAATRFRLTKTDRIMPLLLDTAPR
jgi:hypothetical protein